MIFQKLIWNILRQSFYFCFFRNFCESTLFHFSGYFSNRQELCQSLQFNNFSRICYDKNQKAFHDSYWKQNFKRIFIGYLAPWSLILKIMLLYYENVFFNQQFSIQYYWELSYFQLISQRTLHSQFA